MWGAVAPAIAEQAGTATYDRSGLGRSPRSTGARDLAQLAADLTDVLQHLGPGPFVLVGHSWGGPIVRVAAAARPHLVAGLVLVDPTDERCDLFSAPGHQRQQRLVTPVLPLLARLGLLRLGVRRLAAHLPEPAAAAMRAEDATVAATRALVAELERFGDDLRDLRDAPPALPDVPVTILSGLQPSRVERGQRSALVDAHRASAAALAQGRHVEARRSGHHIPFTEPQLVVAEIRRLLDGPTPLQETSP
jgi:pimeloyl-ACP methyl ester carboxylesterase